MLPSPPQTTTINMMKTIPIRPLRPPPILNPRLYHTDPLSRRHQHVQSYQPLPEAAIVTQKPSKSTPASHPKTPLSLLSLTNLLRSYALTTFSTYPTLLTPSLRLLSILAHSKFPLLNPDHNPLLHFLLKRTFYAQYCAGETPTEVLTTSSNLKAMGFKGVILAYGKEIVLSRNEKLPAANNVTSESKDIKVEADIEAWKLGTLATVNMTTTGDFIALKFSGAGRSAMTQLASLSPPSPSIEAATTEICNLAQARGVRLLFDAEQAAVQRGIDAWALVYQRRYNRNGAVVYGTYQAYLRSTPEVLARHLRVAREEGFVLGVKLVRGAYMGSDPRHLFWGTKGETDECYDGITEAIIQKRWNSFLSRDEGGGFPEVAFVLATHNHQSVTKAMRLKEEKQRRGSRCALAYGQLMGMADEVSCELVMAGRKMRDQAMITESKEVDAVGDAPQAYKYLVWGSVGECLKYLVRRAEENRDAIVRAEGTRVALGREIRRRVWG